MRCRRSWAQAGRTPEGGDDGNGEGTTGDRDGTRGGCERWLGRVMVEVRFGW